MSQDLERALDAAHLAEVELTCRRPDGSVRWRERVDNRLFYEGVTMLLQFAYRGVDGFPVSWRGRLFGGTPTDGDDVGDLVGEPGAGIGYVALEWARDEVDWGVVTLVGIELQTRGLKRTFGPATADWPVVTCLVLATETGGGAKLWARFTLSQPRQVLNGEDLDVRPIGVIRGVTV